MFSNIVNIQRGLWQYTTRILFLHWVLQLHLASKNQNWNKCSKWRSYDSSLSENECLHASVEDSAYKAFTVNYWPDGSITGHSKNLTAAWVTPCPRRPLFLTEWYKAPTITVLSALDPRRTPANRTLCEQAEIRRLQTMFTTTLHVKVQESHPQIRGLQKNLCIVTERHNKLLLTVFRNNRSKCMLLRSPKMLLTDSHSRSFLWALSKSKFTYRHSTNSVIGSL